MDARELMSRTRLYINDEANAAVTDSEMLGLMNDTLNRVSSMSRTIRQGLSIDVLEGQGIYGLPDEFSEIHSAFFRDQRGLVELGQTVLDENVILAEYGSWGPSCYDTWEKAKIAKDVVAIVSVDTGSQTFDYFPTTGAALIGDEIQNSSDSNSLSEVLAVSVDAVTGRTTVRHGDVLGNVRDYQDNDIVRIINPAVTNYAISLAPYPNATDAPGDESLSIYISLKHREITQDMIDNRNDSLEIDSEMFDAVVWDLTHRCQMVIAGAVHPETMKYEQIASQRFWQAFPRVNSRFYTALNLFRGRLSVPRKRHRPIVAA